MYYSRLSQIMFIQLLTMLSCSSPISAGSILYTRELSHLTKGEVEGQTGWWDSMAVSTNTGADTSSATRQRNVSLCLPYHCPRNCAHSRSKQISSSKLELETSKTLKSLSNFDHVPKCHFVCCSPYLRDNVITYKRVCTCSLTRTNMYAHLWAQTAVDSGLLRLFRHENGTPRVSISFVPSQI